MTEGRRAWPTQSDKKMPEGKTGAMEVWDARSERRMTEGRIGLFCKRPKGYLVGGVAIMGGRGKHDQLKFQLFIQEGGSRKVATSFDWRRGS